MNNELEQKRLLFAVGRAGKSLEIKTENLVVKARGISGRKCQNGREEFAFHRNEHIVEYDNEMLSANTKITSKLLARSVKRVVDKNLTSKEASLSA